MATQCILGISGMFWSIAPAIFKDGPEVGKNFVFDIRRTLRQLVDDVQRTMYKLKTHLDQNLALEPSPCDSHSESRGLESTDEVNCLIIWLSIRLICFFFVFPPYSHTLMKNCYAEFASIVN